jgi:hypothetical protein
MMIKKEIEILIQENFQRERMYRKRACKLKKKKIKRKIKRFLLLA